MFGRQPTLTSRRDIVQVLPCGQEITSGTFPGILAGRSGRGKRKRLQVRVKAKEPNEVWTADFKGWWWMVAGEKFLPLTVWDEYSKYLLAIAAHSRAIRPM